MCRGAAGSYRILRRTLKKYNVGFGYAGEEELVFFADAY